MLLLALLWLLFSLLQSVANLLPCVETDGTKKFRDNQAVKVVAPHTLNSDNDDDDDDDGDGDGDCFGVPKAD